MRLIYKDQWRKHIKNPFYFLVMALFFVVIITSFITVRTLLSRLEEPLDDYLKTQNVADFHITLGQIQFQHLTASQQLRLCQQLSILPQCSLYDSHNPNAANLNTINRLIHERIVNRPDLLSEIHQAIENEINLIFNGAITLEKSYTKKIVEDDYTYRFISINETISTPYLYEGNMPVLNHELAIFEAFAKANNYQIGDSITIDEIAYTITGYFYAPDYILPNIESTFSPYKSKTETLLLVNKQAFYTMERTFTTQLHAKGNVYTYQDNFDASDIFVSDLRNVSVNTSLLSTNKNLNMIQTIVPRNLNLSVDMITYEIDTTKIFSSLYLDIFIGLSLLLSIMILKRFIERQQNDFDIYHAMGYTNHQLAKGTTLLSTLLSVIILLAYGLGILISVLVFNQYSSRYQMPRAPLSFNLVHLIIAVILPIIFINTITYLYTRYLLYQRQKETKTSPFTMILTTSKTTLFNALLFVFAVGLLLFGLSANTVFDDFKETTMMGNHFENMVFLKTYRNTDDETIEPFTSTRGKIAMVNDQTITTINIQAYGILPSTTLKRLIDDQVSNNALLNEGVIITLQLAQSKNLFVGDDITFIINNVITTHKVVGIHNDLIERAVYFHRTTLNTMLGLNETYYNAYYSAAYEINDSSAFRILSYKENSEQIETIFQLSNIILSVLMILSLGLSFSMFTVLTIINLENSLALFATLKALGYDSLKTYKIFFLDNLYLLIAAYVLAFGLNIKLTLTLINVLSQRLDYIFIAKISIYDSLISFIVIAVIILLITTYIHYKMNRQDLSIALKKV